MSEALADERHIQFPPKRVRRDLEEIVAWVREIGLAEDVLVRRTLAELATQVREAEMHSLLVLHAMQKGQSGAVEAAANKVAQSVVCQNIARSALEFGGPHALVKGTRVEHLWRQTMWETIGGGTSEIMLSVVARQSLGLGARA
jgi:alkylation response protein AidB-like acyl-CoA dehydrogenase